MPDKQFGMTGLASAMSVDRVLQLVGRASGFTPHPGGGTAPCRWSDLVLGLTAAVGDALASVVRVGGSVILATGHPRASRTCTWRSGGNSARRG